VQDWQKRDEGAIGRTYRPIPKYRVKFALWAVRLICLPGERRWFNAMLALPQDKSSQPVIGCPSQPPSAAYDSAPSADLKRLWIVDGKSPMRIFNRREDPGLLDVRQKRELIAMNDAQ
jgi:hypothetical protein